MAKVAEIPRYNLFIDCTDRDIDPSGKWLKAEDVEKVFPPNVAFMPVPRCELCQHWEQHDSFSPTGECRQIEADDNGPVNPAAIMPVEASLTVRSDFGCVLFQAKPQTDPDQ